MKTFGFATCRLAHLRNLRRKWAQRIRRSAIFGLTIKNFDLRTGTPKKLADYESGVSPGICGFAICWIEQKSFACPAHFCWKHITGTLCDMLFHTNESLLIPVWFSPMIYTAPPYMLLMRPASSTRASGRGLGPGDREIFGALWNGIEPISECHLGPKKARWDVAQLGIGNSSRVVREM